MTRRNIKAGVQAVSGLELTVFSDDELRSIHEATLEVLQETGLRFEGDKALEIFHGAGAQMERSNGYGLVRIPPYVVEDCIGWPPSTVVYHGREADDDFVAEPKRVGLINGGGCVNVMDSELVGMIMSVVKGIDITDQTLALDVIHDVGPGGEFLTHDRTYAHVRELSRGTLFDRAVGVVWSAAGGKDLTERAYDLPHPVVSIMGIGEANSPVDIHQSDVMAGPTPARAAGDTAFEMAGIRVNDVDACEIYDCFTYTVEITLQDYGFFGPGEGKDWFGDGRTAPGGTMPVNTSGGLLSEAYLMGLTPITEAVLQLMGRCGDRQLGPRTETRKPEIILCCDNGAVFQSHATIILRKT